MRVSREKAAENRDRIVLTAARLFREKGFDGVGIDAIMQAADLTHGGFYRHFQSKDDLSAEAVARGLATNAEYQASLSSLRAFAAGYLSPEHRDDRAGGCTVAALVSEMGRQGPGVRRKLTQAIQEQFDRIAGWLPGRSKGARRREAMTAYAGLVGTLVLARAVDDAKLSGEILAAGRAAFSGRRSAQKSARRAAVENA